MRKEDFIDEQLKIKAIREMKNPNILMNDLDFREWKKELESEVVNFKVGIESKFRGIPIHAKSHVKRGQIIFFDKTDLN